MQRACDEQNLKTGTGVVVQSKNGEVIAVMTDSHSSFLSPLCTEARSNLKGLRLAQRMDISKLQVFSDSLSLISMINGSEKCMSDV